MMMTEIKRWWCGRSGDRPDSVRQDIYLRTDTRRWAVEYRKAGRVPRSARYTYATEDEAWGMSCGDGWGNPDDWQEVALDRRV